MPLRVRDLTVGYGAKQVVHEASLDIGEREIVVLIGHNGAGKSTLLDGIFGVLSPIGGTVLWNERPVARRSPSTNLRAGIGYAPQGGQVYRTLSVAENLALGAFALSDRRAVARNIERVYQLFPVLRERRQGRAGSLSGGERQMLSVGAVLAASPRLALLDEPSGGIAPILVEKMFQTLRGIVDEFGTSILLVEQNLEQAFAIADRVYVMAAGRIVLEGTPAALEADARFADVYFGAAGGPGSG